LATRWCEERMVGGTEIETVAPCAVAPGQSLGTNISEVPEKFKSVSPLADKTLAL
jgi:hypothetical protein